MIFAWDARSHRGEQPAGRAGLVRKGRHEAVAEVAEVHVERDGELGRGPRHLPAEVARAKLSSLVRARDDLL